MSNQTSQPLAWSQNGDPIELPDTAVLWRVRRLISGTKGGAPEIVYGADGLPLAVDIGMTPQDFAEAVERKAGKYRLDALDEAKKAIAGVPPAYVVVGGAAARGEAPAGEPHEIALRALADALAKQSEALIKQSAQIASITDACSRVIAALDGTSLARRGPAPAPAPASEAGEKRRNARRTDDEDGDDEPAEKTPLQQVAAFVREVGPEGIVALGTSVPQMVGGVIQEFKDKLGGGKGADGGGES